MYFNFFRYCGILDPSWAELHHFANFLNVQLDDCEKSVFWDNSLVGDKLKGFKKFLVCSMIEMSRVRSYFNIIILMS